MINRSRNSHFSRTTFLISITSCFLVLLVCYLLYSSSFKKEMKNYIENNKQLSFDQKQMGYFEQNFTLSKTDFIATDPFIRDDFIKIKLSKLVSSIKQASHFKKQGTSLENDVSSFTYLLNELMSAFNVYNFFNYLAGCKALENIQIGDLLDRTENKLIYPATYNKESVLIEQTRLNMDEFIAANCGSSDSDTSQENLDRCFLLKNRRLLQEAVLLVQLSHVNIAKLVGICIQRSTTESQKPMFGGVRLVKEGGETVNLEKLKLLSWDQRIKICTGLVGLANYFSWTQIGTVLLENWKPDNFIISSKSGTIKLFNLDQHIYVTERFCHNDKECFIDGINAAVPCEDNFCVGYNAKKNLYELNRSILSPVLRYNVPPELGDQILDILMKLNNLKLTTRELGIILNSLSHGANHPLVNDHKARNPAVISMDRLPDGSQVDSWEQHEMKVSINEVSPGGKRNHFPAEEEGVIEEQEKEEEKPDKTGYHKIENADYPGRFDYFCPKSKAEWGCVMSLATIEDAMQKCNEDAKCKAIVTIPHLRKEGWLIGIFKSDNSKPVDHAGTTVYVRIFDSPNHTPILNLPSDLQSNIGNEDCLGEIISSQAQLRLKLESSLMKTCGWEGMTDQDYDQLITNGIISDATKFNPARGKLANGGQMDVEIYSNGGSRSATFLAKRGPEEFDVSQLAVYQLDRMLGLYKTVPAIERLMTETELSNAGFPVDIGGNQFDKFKPLKQSDNSLIGVVVPKIPERVNVEHFLSVPKLDRITNAVTPFSRRQWNDMEYLILGFLASIPIPSKGHLSVRGHLLHVKTEGAFIHNTDDYTTYLYNCQFPTHVIATLKHAQAHHCAIGGQIRTRLFDGNSPRISVVVEQNIAKLLELVDKCVTKFGKQIVLYDSQAR